LKRRGWVALAFLAPALLVLGALVVWPAIRTIYDSFFDRFGQEFVGFDNYQAMFRFDRMRIAIFNSFIWVVLFPVIVTTVGLVLAVLSDKVGWKRAFRLVIFIPAAIAILSSGIIWRVMYEADPSRGVINALINVPVSLVRPAGELAGAAPSTDSLVVEEDGSVTVLVDVDGEGAVAQLGLLRITEAELPEDAIEAVAPQSGGAGTINGVVWRDTRPGDNVKGVVEPGELGVPAVTVVLVDEEGNEVAQASSAPDGTFAFEGVEPGSYRTGIDGGEFREPWGGIIWLGADLVTYSAIFSGMWIWAGFALLVIAAGLASLPRDTLEAARVDGANEWQVLRHVTVPQLSPVLIVVFIALTINALKMFDLIVGIAPGSVQDDANVIALEMWRTAFTGVGNRGVGSAIAVFLFLLILPILVLNIRRFTLSEGER
jgi:alpha-glucoside transport system permease protein